MRAVGYRTPGAIERPDALEDIELPRPSAGGCDLLVEVKAISVNPVDTKVRTRMGPADGAEWRVLGWDVAGTVVEAGPDVTRFSVGDAVFYAGDLTRQGANAEFHLIDERLVGHKPHSLDWAEAAALPLTAVTAWETLFDRLDVRRAVPGSSSILLIGGAGGVGSIALQLARQLTELTVIATASRPETADWVKSLGAHHVLDHSRPLAEQVSEAGLEPPGFVFSITHTDDHLPDIIKLIAPQGRLGLIDDPKTIEISPFKQKAVSVHWEYMFTRSMFRTPDMGRQGDILEELSRLVDAGTIRTTLGERLGTINAKALIRAHELLESGKARGKIVLEGF